jgi:ATP phosphoribosyltransferase
MRPEIRFGLPKGRLLDPARALLERAGIAIDHDQETSRLLTFPDRSGKYSFVVLKPVDIPVYVEAGALDVGIAGTDILREQQSDVHEPLDLRIGLCRLVVAGRGEENGGPGLLRVATKYPRTAEAYFRARNTHVHIMKLDGSVEIAPLLGLSDVIVDLVESGRTLRENGLQVLEEIAQVSAKLIVNRTSMKLRAGPVGGLVEQLDRVVYANS